MPVDDALGLLDDRAAELVGEMRDLCTGDLPRYTSARDGSFDNQAWVRAEARGLMAERRRIESVVLADGGGVRYD